jgi:hypothetical protein
MEHFENGRAKALQEIGNKHPLLNAEKPWYTVRLWLASGEDVDDSFQAATDAEAIQMFKNPRRKPPAKSEGELRKVDSGRYGSTTHLADYKW